MTHHFKPVSGDHAIERVVFSLAFDRSFDAEDISQIRKQHAVWATDLPALRDPPGFMIVTEPEISAVTLPAVEFAFLRPDGSAVWSMRIMGPEVVIECSRYTRWAKVWDAAQRHLARFLAIKWPGSGRALAKASLVVQDAFVCDEGEADFPTLLNEGPLLPTSLFDAGPNWHVHTGRFFGTEIYDRILSNVNVDAVLQSVITDGEARETHRVSILHILVADRSVTDSQEDSAVLEWLRERMDKFHSCNKAMLIELLHAEQVARVGLKMGDAA
jgi:hypothetical protein